CFVQRGDDGVSVNRPRLVIETGALIAGDVETRESPAVLRDRTVVRSREAHRRQVESLVRGIVTVNADEPVVAVSHVQNGRRVESVNVIERALPGNELEQRASRNIIEIVVVGAIPIIPTCPPEDAILLADVVIDADRAGVVARPLL